MFITRCNQAVPVIADDLEYKSLLGAPNHVESDGLIIDLYLVDRDSLRCLFVDCLQVFLPFVMSSRMNEVIIARDLPLYRTNSARLRALSVSVAVALGVIGRTIVFIRT